MNFRICLRKTKNTTVAWFRKHLFNGAVDQHLHHGGPVPPSEETYLPIPDLETYINGEW